VVYQNLCPYNWCSGGTVQTPNPSPRAGDVSPEGGAASPEAAAGAGVLECMHARPCQCTDCCCIACMCACTLQLKAMRDERQQQEELLLLKELRRSVESLQQVDTTIKQSEQTVRVGCRALAHVQQQIVCCRQTLHVGA
jgi:hypothetical protein